ncbi:hypothetical protein [Umezawaea tangerina]|uniref:Uncharacterized protein n=1 Tax=Umezawaea tangerina TaxID=84725 RepID=A0A2T0SPK6_9PSEU|nr:hypothetical protein [Umezawaea tangerina]PRY35293.1 hypothetical protein CLV43_114211 [Umezawaea tangerina]
MTNPRGTSNALPVPQHLAHRPTQGGLVVPWVSVELANGTFDLGNMNNTRANQCFVRRRCQVCGQRIGARAVFLLSESALESMSAGEPPLHPECAAYSKAACPMVAGRVDHYRRSPTRTEGHAGEECATPGCDCAGWIPTPGGGDNTGRPAEPWHLVWCAGYDITVPDKRTGQLVNRGLVPIGVRLRARISAPLKIRPIAG